MIEHFGKFLGTRIVSSQEPIAAWRSWSLERSGWKSYRLQSTWRKHYYWAPGINAIERCPNCNLGLRIDCQCGFWGCKSIGNLAVHGSIGVYPMGLIGQVALWGIVHEYMGGFRAALARPTRLYTVNPDGQKVGQVLSQSYGIPVECDLPADAAHAVLSAMPAESSVCLL